VRHGIWQVTDARGLYTWVNQSREGSGWACRMFEVALVGEVEKCMLLDIVRVKKGERRARREGDADPP